MDRSLRTLELSHRQTSNFEMCLLYFIHTCNILLNIKDYLSFTKKTGLVLVCRNLAAIALRHHCFKIL